MNPECSSNSVHASPRSQQTQRTLSPPEYAAAGDAPRGQILPDLSLVISTEIFAMDTSLLTTATTDDIGAKSKLDNPCARRNVGQIFNFSNDSLQIQENVLVSVTDEDASSMRRRPDAKLSENNDKKIRITSKSRTIENTLDCDISLEREPPCKEYSRKNLIASNHENLVDDERSSLVDSDLTKVMATKETSIHPRKNNENYSTDKIFSPDRKISMFSKEIWTEKVLPIDTFVCPEPELVEIYCDKKKMSDQFERFGKYTTESIDSSITRGVGNRGVLERNVSINPSLPARKDRTSSTGQKTINFDDEIWPVCPKLIPSGKELSTSILDDRHEIISPEKLNENDEEVLSTTPSYCSPLKVASIFGVSSRSSTTEQYDLEGSFMSEKMIEPTHEIEGQNDLASTSDTRKFCDGNYSRSLISQANVAAVERPQRFFDTHKIMRDPSLVMNARDQTESLNFWDKLPKSEPLSQAKTIPRLTQVSSSKQRNSQSLDLRKERTLKKKPLSVSNSEPVSTVLNDILNRREIHSFCDAKLPAISCNQIVSLDNMKVKQSKEDCGSSFHAYPIAETVKQVSFAISHNHEIVYDHSEETSHTPTNIRCEISRKVDELSRLSASGSRNNMRKMSAELNPRKPGTSSEIHEPENHVRTLDATRSSKLPITESRNVEEGVSTQEIEKKRKCVKVVRFKTCDRHGDTKYHRTGTEVQENFEGRDIRPGHSKSHLDFDDTNDTPDCMSVESFKQKIDQIARQIEIDPSLDDAVVTLARVEIILEANRQTVERLQQLQPNVAIPHLTPPDAGRSLAKALTRCRHYMQNSGYSSDATDTINKQLTSTVHNLKQLVERHKLILVARGKKRCAAPGGRRQSKKWHQENSLNTRGVLIAEEFGVNQVQCLISDILALTEKFGPKINGKESQRKSPMASSYSHNDVKNSTKNRRMIMDAAPAETKDTDSSEESKIMLEVRTSRMRQPFDVPEPNKVKEAIKTGSEKLVVFSGASSNPRVDSDQQKMQNRRHLQRPDKELETTQSPIARSTHSKKMSSTESTKTLKKLFNELWEKRSKTLSRHYNINDSTNNLRPLAASHHATINQKPPIWKPGGNNLVQPSMSVIPNNQKIRPSSISAVNKKRNNISEHTRDTRPHQRTKATSGVINDPLKILEKSIIRPHNTTSLAKMRADPGRGHQSDVLSLGRSKVQIAAEVDQPRTRKPRSKSRTRTKTSNKIPRITVTEIPLEHANDRSPVTEKKICVVNELALTKASSSPKDIMKMLEELIKCSGNETSIHNTSTVQVVGRCNVAVNDVNDDADCSELLKTKVKLTNEIALTSCSERGDPRTEESSLNQSIQSKTIHEIVEKNENTDEINGNENLINEDEASVRDNLTKPCDLQKQLDSISALNAEKIFTVSRSNSEATSNRSTEERTAPSVSNIGCSAELSSEPSTGSVFSKYCQASLTSLTSHEISEELIFSQISDQRNSCCEEIQKDSNESFDPVEDDEVTRENQSTSASSGATPKKKYVNRYAKSLEMLQEILSDQGLDMHLLSRAENVARDRCKCSSSKKGLTARRSLQSANCTSPKFSGEPIKGVSLRDRNCSTTLCSTLATLSESESDIDHVEVATMTTANESTLSKNDRSTLAEFDSYCDNENEALSRKVITVENATQFEVTSRSDMCVGDDTICDTYVPFTTKNQENLVDNSSASYDSPTTFKSSSPTHGTLLVDERESFDFKLADEILDTFRLAAIRAANFYAAVNILRENTPSESIVRSSSAVNSDSNDIFTHMPNPEPLTAADESPVTDETGSEQVRHLSQVFSTDNGIKLPVQTENSNTASPVRIIIPRKRAKANEEANCCEPTKSVDNESPIEKVAGMNMMAVKEFNRQTTEDELRLRTKVNFSKPAVLPKPFLFKKNAFGTTVERQSVVKEYIVDPSPVLTVENRSSRNTAIPRSAAFMQKKTSQSPSLNQHSLVKRCITEKQIETLHFAGRQIDLVDGNTTSVKLKDGIESNPRSLNANSANYGSLKPGEQIRDSFAGSRIKTLLKENLQRFNIDYSPIINEEVFTDFKDQLSTESIDDESLINKVADGITTSTSCAQLDDSNISSEVIHLLNSLLNEIEENCESSTITEQHHLPRNTHSPRHRRLRKHVRRLKLERTKRTVCSKYWNNLSEMVVSREHLLSVIYAVICSFVFCCLRLSVRCEV